MRKIMALPTAVVLWMLVLPLAGCGGGGSTNAGTSGPATSTAAPTASTTASSSMPANNNANSAMMPHRSFAERHKTATSLAAGIAAYQLAKRTGNNRAAAGRNKNWAQRHPMATAVGAAMLTHHAISVQQRKHQQY